MTIQEQPGLVYLFTGSNARIAPEIWAADRLLQSIMLAARPEA